MPVVSRLNALTSLRFLAAFAIVIHHSRGTLLTADTLSNWPLDSAVSFFFVLSGFILTHVYPELPTRQHVIRFLVARFARLWPVHVLSLLVALLLIPDFLLKSELAFIANISATHAWVPRGDFFFSFNAVSWSISAEVGFYLMFPFLINNLRSTWGRKLALSLLAALLLIAVCVMLDLPSFDPNHKGLTSTGLLYTNPLARLFEFVLGMVAAVWWKTYRQRVDNSNTIQWTLIECTSIAAVIIYIVYLRLPAFGFVSPLLPGNLTNWLVHTDISPFFALLIVVTANGAGWISRALGSALFVFLGEVSYSVYMLHQIILGCLARYELIPLIPHQWQLFTAAILTIVFSAASYLLIERPMREVILTLAFRPRKQSIILNLFGVRSLFRPGVLWIQR
jgi:peptidoglycan/LPS O-acetylase OafA/YrhL